MLQFGKQVHYKLWQLFRGFSRRCGTWIFSTRLHI